MSLVRNIVFTALLALLSAPLTAQGPPGQTGSAQTNPWADARLKNWSQQINFGQYDLVIQEVEADLESPSPHPFSVDIWCRLQLRHHTLDAALASMTNPALKQALGVAPRLYALEDADKVGELVRLGKSLPLEQIHGSMTYRELLWGAISATDYDQAFAWAMRSIRTQDPSFIIVWDTINLAEDDLRIRDKLKATLASDPALAASPAGLALTGMLELEAADYTGTNCGGSYKAAEERFKSVVGRWLSVYPDDAGALQFAAIHMTDLHDDWQASAAELQTANDAYPLLLVWSVKDAILAAEFGSTSDEADAAGLKLSQRLATLKEANAPKAKALSFQYASWGLLHPGGCSSYARPEKDREWILQAQASIPDQYQAPLHSQLAEIDLIPADDQNAAIQAVAEARKALALDDSFSSDSRLIRALLKTKIDADDAEALQRYKTTQGIYADHSEEFYEAGNTALERLGDCNDQQHNWQTALKEYPNAAWALSGLATAQDRCSHPKDAIASMTKLFQIVVPSPTYLPQMEALWAELGSASDMDAKRTQFIQEEHAQFRGFSVPSPIESAAAPSAAIPVQLKLEPQTPLTERITAMAVNGDGTLAAAADLSGAVKLWGMEAPVTGQAVCSSIFDPTCPRILRTIYAHTGSVDELQFSSDKQWLISSAASDGEVRVWRVSTGALAWSVTGKKGIAPRVAIRPAVAGQTPLVAVAMRKPDPPQPGYDRSDTGWVLLTVCPLSGGDSCKSVNWYKNADFDSNEQASLTSSADGRLLAVRVSNSESLQLDWDSLRLVRHGPVAAQSVHAPDLSAVVFPDGTALKYQLLTSGSTPFKLVDLIGNPLDAQILSDGRIRYAVLEQPLAASKDSDSVDSGESAASKPASPPREANINIFELSGPVAQSPRLIATLRASDFPAPQFSLGSIGDRFTMFSKAIPSQRAIGGPTGMPLPSPTMVVGYYNAADPSHPLLQVLKSQMQLEPNSISFSPGHNLLLVDRGAGQETRLDIWDLAEQGQPRRSMHTLKAGRTTAVDGEKIVTCFYSNSDEGFIRTYDLNGKGIVSATPRHCLPEVPIVRFADGKGVAWASDVRTLTVAWGAEPARTVGSIPEGETIKAVAAGGGIMLAASGHEIYKFDPTGAPVDLCTDACPSDTGSFSALAIGTNADYAIAAIGPSEPHSTPPASFAYGVVVVDLRTGALHAQKDSADSLPDTAVTSVAFLPNSTTYAVGTVDGRVLLADAATDGAMQTLFTEDSPVAAVTVSPDGSYLATALDSGSVLLWQLTPDRHQIARLDIFSDGDWSVVTPSGQYDAAHAGRLDELFWVYGTSTIQLDQMISTYYRSRLLPRLMNFDTTPLAASPPLNKFDPALPPDVTIVSIDPVSEQVIFSSSSPIKDTSKIQVFLNGSWVDTSDITVDADDRAHVTLAGHHALAAGETNQVSIVVGNPGGTINSRGMNRKFTASGPASTVPREFYAIVAGISRYGNGLPSLPLADLDAQDMTREIARGAVHLLGNPALVHIYLLTSDEQKGREIQAELVNSKLGTAEWMTPSHANFQKAFGGFSHHLKPGDIFLLFLAGHGELTGDGSYGYPTSEPMSAFSSKAVLTSRELESSLRVIGASNSILVFDTCNSGAFIDQVMQQLQKLKQSIDPSNSTTFMLMGASAGQPALDSVGVGHGFLTAGLLESMRDNLFANHLNAADWLDGAKTDTETIATEHNSRQLPQEEKGGKSALDVAVFSPSEIDCIPDLHDAPLVAPPSFAATDRDGPDIQETVQRLLTDQSDPSLPSRRAILDHGPGSSNAAHIQVSVDEQTSDGRLTITLTYRYGSKEYDQPPDVIAAPFTGLPTDQQRSDLAHRMVEKIDHYAQWVWAEKQRRAAQTAQACSTISSAGQ